MINNITFLLLQKHSFFFNLQISTEVQLKEDNNIKALGNLYFLKKTPDRFTFWQRVKGFTKGRFSTTLKNSN